MNLNSINVCSYHIRFLEEGTEVPGLIHHTGLSCRVATDDVAVIASSDEQRTQQGAVLKTIPLLSFQHCGR